jgi:hypothetical protein
MYRLIEPYDKDIKIVEKLIEKVNKWKLKQSLN